MERIHFIGIGGTGMGPLAKVFVEQGRVVSGSDLQSSETTESLADLGATIFIGHSSAHIEHCDIVVYSSAIPESNPELQAARSQGLKVYHRSEVWAELLNNGRGVAVGGAHGKTTITSMISWILEQSGLDPTVLIGARFAPFGPGAKYGRGGMVIAEADESDRSFLRYRPEVAVVTSIEADHLENYNGAFSELVQGYTEFLHNVNPSGLVVLGYDDPILQSLAAELPSSVVSYGFQPGAVWRAEVLSFHEHGVTFAAYVNEVLFGHFELSVPGRHNVSNALAALAVGSYFGLTAEAMRRPLATFCGAQRRFQILGEAAGILVVDDYAHHPTEIAATLRAAAEGWQRRVVAVFQPQRYTRTQLLFHEFTDSFGHADVVFLTDIYSPPPETPISGVSAEIMAERMRAKGVNVRWVGEQEHLMQELLDHLDPGDIVITMGAGPIWKTARQLLVNLESRQSSRA